MEQDVKATIRRVVEEEIASVEVEAAVRYGEEDMPSDYPGRSGDLWRVSINPDTGQIANWPKGVAPRDIHMNVCDGGTYTLRGASGEEVGQIDCDYVPSGFPGEHYGDYLIFDIDAEGRITNWDAGKFEMRIGQFIRDDD